MKNSKKNSSSKPNELVDRLDKVRVLHVLFNFLPHIFFFRFFGFHNNNLTIKVYKPFATK